MVEVELVKFKHGIAVLEVTDTLEIENAACCLTRRERVKLALALLSPRKRHTFNFETEE